MINYELIIGIVFTIAIVIAMYWNSASKKYDERQIKERMKAFRNGFIVMLALSSILMVYTYTKLETGIDPSIIFNGLTVIIMSGLITVACTEILSNSYDLNGHETKMSSVVIWGILGIFYMYDAYTSYHLKWYHNPFLAFQLMFGIEWLSMAICMAIRKYKNKMEDREDEE